MAAGPAAAAGAGAAAGVEPVSVRTTSALGAVSVVVKAVLSPHSTTPRTVSTLNTPGYAHANTHASTHHTQQSWQRQKRHANQEIGRRNEEQQGKATSSCVRACVRVFASSYLCEDSSEVEALHLPGGKPHLQPRDPRPHATVHACLRGGGNVPRRVEIDLRLRKPEQQHAQEQHRRWRCPHKSALMNARMCFLQGRSSALVCPDRGESVRACVRACVRVQARVPRRLAKYFAAPPSLAART